MMKYKNIVLKFMLILSINNEHLYGASPVPYMNQNSEEAYTHFTPAQIKKAIKIIDRMDQHYSEVVEERHEALNIAFALKNELQSIKNPRLFLLKKIIEGLGDGLSIGLGMTAREFAPMLVMYGYQKYIDPETRSIAKFKEQAEAYERFQTLNSKLFGGTITVPDPQNEGASRKITVRGLFDVYDKEIIKQCYDSKIRKEMRESLPELITKAHLALNDMTSQNKVNAMRITLAIQEKIDAIDTIKKSIDSLSKEDYTPATKEQTTKTLQSEVNKLCIHVMHLLRIIPMYANKNVYADNKTISHPSSTRKLTQNNVPVETQSLMQHQNKTDSPTQTLASENDTSTLGLISVDESAFGND